MLKEFEDFLGNKFDNQNKSSKDETHRWLFCWNGEQDNEMPFDCACCCTDSKEILKIQASGKACGCICHTRIKQIHDFFMKEIIKMIEKNFIDSPLLDHVIAKQAKITATCINQMLENEVFEPTPDKPCYEMPSQEELEEKK